MKNPEELGYLEARLELLATARGGRLSPIRSGYMPNWWLPGTVEPILASAALELVDHEELSPGASGVVRIYPFVPEIWSEIGAGMDLKMTEGPRWTVGHATVVRVVPAATPAR
ncbi:MAG: hypothetical protein H0U10_10470 [Chloroflexia bacterium]|nr:hypothetical protein [Chloroflexia bacterium]